MIDGFLRINFLLFLTFIFPFVDTLEAENILLGPLINLNQIEPSYESLDEKLLEDGVNIEPSDDNIFEEGEKLSYASISILNKITANVESLDIRLKKNHNYEDLRIYPIDCYLSSPEDKPETAVYLNIYHNSRNEKLFSGWMLKTLPSISSIEHPIYDIWVNKCY